MPEQPDGRADAGAIHIALTFDDRYWAPAYAVMRSVCLTTRRRKALVFHLFVQGVSAVHLADLMAINAEFGARLAVYDLAQDTAFQQACAGLRQSRRFPLVVYARLFIDRLLPAEVARVLYLDCDTLVLKPIEQLYAQELGGRPIAAVREPFGLHIKMGRDMRRKQEAFDAADAYFNSGVLLIDVAGYAAAGIPAQIAALDQRGMLKRLYYDQDILNFTFAGRWQELDWRFNVLEGHVAHHAMGVHIVHYSDRRRPWHLFANVPFHRTYRHVMTNALFYRYMRYRWARAARRLIGRR